MKKKPKIAPLVVGASPQLARAVKKVLSQLTPAESRRLAAVIERMRKAIPEGS